MSVGVGPGGETQRRRALLALLAVVLLSAGTVACGSAHRVAPSTAAALPEVEIVKGDADNDSDSYGDEPDDEADLLFGHPAGAAEARAVAALVRRYYAVAAGGDGARGCGLLYATLVEAIPQDYGGLFGLRGRGDTCPAVLSKIFRQHHARLHRESEGLRVVAVRVDFDRASAQFGYTGARPTHYIMAHRQFGHWKMDMLTDAERPIGKE